MVWKGWEKYDPSAPTAGEGAPKKGNARVKNATPVVVDGIRFHSKKEGARWRELKARVVAGQVRDLYRQVRFDLHAFNPAAPEKGFIKIGSYVADFVYFDVERGQKVVEDTKGWRTEMYLWKKKHAEAEWGIAIEET